jgi:hypothetical protein
MMELVLDPKSCKTIVRAALPPGVVQLAGD